MSFASLKEKIVGQATQKLEIERDKFAKEFLEEEDRIKLQARQTEEVVIADAESRAKQEAKRLHQAAQLKARADILQAKQEELDAVLQDSIEEVLNWNETDTRKLLEALFGLVPGTEGVVAAGDKHEKLVREMAKKEGLTVSDQTIAGTGGFLYSGSSTEINLTVHYIVAQSFSRGRSGIARILF